MSDVALLQYSQVMRETEKALLVNFGLTHQCWIPKSCSEVIDETFSLIQIDNWLVGRNNLQEFVVDKEEEEIKERKEILTVENTHVHW